MPVEMNENNLKGKKVVITAAAQGIGRATAEAFALLGAEVWATDIDAGLLEDMKATPGMSVRKLDVRDGSAIRRLSSETGSIDVLFNCAGFVHNGTILDSSDAELDDAFNLNVKSMYRTITTFLPGMLENGSGSIVNMASVCGSVKGVPSRCIYGLTKAAVIGLTKSVAADYVTRGIRCNAICPGTVETPSLEGRLRATGNYESARAAFIARQPIGRFGRAQEIADLVLYLATAEYTTGQVHIIDGGWTT
jgi:2-keto-3-deoxy-L-fuconate dehydrogenase